MSQTMALFAVDIDVLHSVFRVGPGKLFSTGELELILLKLLAFLKEREYPEEFRGDMVVSGRQFVQDQLVGDAEDFDLVLLGLLTCCQTRHEEVPDIPYEALDQLDEALAGAHRGRFRGLLRGSPPLAELRPLLSGDNVVTVLAPKDVEVAIDAYLGVRPHAGADATLEFFRTASKQGLGVVLVLF